MRVLTSPIPVVSAPVYGLILASPRLREALLPHGSVTSPYEILDYDATLTLEDPRGAVATFARSQEVRFLEPGVSAMLDHLWGDGVSLTDYSHSAGRLEESFIDQGRRHLVIGLGRMMARGETLRFAVRRTAMVSFTKSEEWVETTIDHPIRRLSRRVVFPKARPCRAARLCYEGRTVELPVRQLASGKTVVRFEVLRPASHTPYTVRWLW